MTATVNQILLEIFLCTASWIVVLPIYAIFFPILVIFIMYKCIVNLIVCVIHPTWFPLSGLDISIAIGNDLNKSEGKFLGNLGFMIELSTTDVDIQFIRSEFETKVLNLKNNEGSYRYDRLRKYPFKFMWHYYWKDVIGPINIDNLIKERAQENSTDLTEFLENWLHMGYEDGQPMWEIVLYKNLGKSVLLIKMAHCIGDGLSAMCIVARIFGTSVPQQEQINWIPFRQKVLLALKEPRLIIQHIRTIVRSPDYMCQSPKLTDMRIGFTKIKVKTIKRIKDFYGGRFSDVLLHVIASTLRKYIVEQVAEPEAKISTYIKILSTMAAPTHRDTACNDFANHVFRVPMKNPKRIERFQEFISESRYQYGTNTHKLTYCLVGFLYWIPTFLFYTPADFKPGYCCAVTSVPSTFDTSTVFGKYLTESVSIIMGLQAKQTGLLATCNTDRDELRINLVGNKGIFCKETDMEHLIKYIEEEVDFLINQIDGKLY